MGSWLGVAAAVALVAVPPHAVQYLPTLQQQTRQYWPGMHEPSVLAGQVEQETCVSLKSARCWSRRAELRTSRERGVGLGQITKTARKDSLAELKQFFPDALSRFTWRNPYDATLQLRALVLKDEYNYTLVSFGKDERERIAFALAAYNGGMDGLIQDRSLCSATPGCDPSQWFDNVEKHSLKATLTTKGYGQSFFCINREYPWKIMFDRSRKYQDFFNDGTANDAVPAGPTSYGC